jgi:hypothetical protein
VLGLLALGPARQQEGRRHPLTVSLRELEKQALGIAGGDAQVA